MLLGIALPLLGQVNGFQFAPPFLAKAGGKPIQVEVGHASPLFTDFDGDKLPDLLVGQFGWGQLRIYKNVGSRTEPKFDKFEWFQAAGATAKIEAG